MSTTPRQHVPSQIDVVIDTSDVARVAVVKPVSIRTNTSWGTTRQTITVTAFSDPIGTYAIDVALNDAYDTAARRATNAAAAIIHRSKTDNPEKS